MNPSVGIDPEDGVVATEESIEPQFGNVYDQVSTFFQLLFGDVGRNVWGDDMDALAVERDLLVQGQTAVNYGDRQPVAVFVPPD